MRRWKRVVLFCSCFLVACGLMVTGVLAYMTDRDESINIVSIGDVHIQAFEPNFPTEDEDDDGVPDECELLVPFEEVPKDPYIKNTGTNDAIVFFRVVAPVETLKLIKDDGTREAEADCDLFWFKQKGDSEDLHKNHWNSSWVMLSKYSNQFVQCAECNEEGKGYVYYFGYSTRLGTGELTTTLFDKIQNKKYGAKTINGEEVEQVRVTAYAIQADELQKAGLDMLTEGTLSESDLTHIFEIFVNQNDSLDVILPSL